MSTYNQMKVNMKANKKELLERITKMSKKGGKLETAVLTLALQKLDSEDFAIDEEGVYNSDRTQLVYSRGDREEVSIPATIQTIGEMAFAGKKHLKKVTLPKGLKDIAREAFADCDALEEIVLPASVETVEPYAFSDCDRLKRVVFEGAPKKVSRKAFDSCDELHDISVPDDIVKALRKALHLNDGDINYLVVGHNEDKGKKIKEEKKKDKKDKKEEKTAKKNDKADKKDHKKSDQKAEKKDKKKKEGGMADKPMTSTSNTKPAE